MTNFSKPFLTTAIRLAQNQISWKPGKAEIHLAKRIRLGHLPPAATLADYESLIIRLLNTPDANIYVYEFGETIYPTLVTSMEQQVWLVMIAMNGILETAFPPDMPEEYLSNPSFTYVGLVGEIS
jgi:hypothetical protein